MWFRDNIDEVVIERKFKFQVSSLTETIQVTVIAFVIINHRISSLQYDIALH